MARLLGLIILALILALPASANAGQLGLHSMLYPETSYQAKEQMFAEASEAGASMIRVDISLASIFIENEHPELSDNYQEWSRVDQFAQLAKEYNMPLLIVLYGTPDYLSDCSGDAYLRCPPNNLERWQKMIGTIVARYRDVSNNYEIINEPDQPRYFTGSADQYVAMLAAAHSAIKDNNPQGNLVLGGISDAESFTWTDEIMARGAGQWIDIPAIHLRSSATGAARLTAEWRQYFTDRGINGPLWLTEFGYPAEADNQWDPSYNNGEESQAQFYQDTLPWLAHQGAEQIFVTQRDWGGGSFASEGLIESPDPLPSGAEIRRRPSFYIFQNYSKFLPTLPPPAKQGSIIVSPEQTKRIIVRGKSISLTFSCPEEGDCPKQSFRLRLSRGGSYLIRLPFGIKGKSEARVSVKLSKRTRKLLKRGEIKGSVFNLKEEKLTSLRLVRRTK